MSDKCQSEPAISDLGGTRQSHKITGQLLPFPSLQGCQMSDFIMIFDIGTSGSGFPFLVQGLNHAVTRGWAGGLTSSVIQVNGKPEPNARAEVLPLRHTSHAAA